ILQPTDPNQFKQKFKRVSQGIFDQASFDIVCRNSAITIANPLKIEFLPCDEDDAVQLTIEYEDSTASSIQPNNAIASQASQTEKLSSNINTLNAINRQLTKQPAEVNALVIVTLSSCPDDVFKHN
ncbi:hypothetical protein, partial [Pseudomonas aeruginosa]